MTEPEFAASLYAQEIAVILHSKAERSGDLHAFYRAFAAHIIGQAAGVLGTAGIHNVLQEAEQHFAERPAVPATPK